MKKIKLILYILIVTGSALTQEKSFLQLHGTVFNGMSGEPIANVHVINRNLLLVDVSDSLGRFSISAYPGDSIVFSSMGYQFTTRGIDLSDSIGELYIQVNMQPATYLIDEISVISLGDYDDFKRKFMEEGFEETEVQKFQRKYIEMAKEEASQVEPENLNASIPIWIFRSKEDKSRQKLKEIKEQNAVFDQIYEKVNRQLIFQITGLQDDSLSVFIYKFIADCKISVDHTEYEISEKARNYFNSTYRDNDKAAGN